MRYWPCLLLLAVGAARAEPACREGHLAESLTELRLAVAKDKLFFHSEGPGCPDDKPACRNGASVAAGEDLLVGETVYSWACAQAANGRRGTVGWVNMAGLNLQTPATPLPSDWSGTWLRPGSADFIAIAFKGGELRAAGHSGHPGANSEFEGPILLDGASGVVSDPGEIGRCEVRLQRLGRYLLVQDNASCGSLQARISGAYTKSKK